MIHLYVGPGVTIVRSLLQVERVELVRLRRRPGHQSIEHCGVPFDTRTADVGAKGQFKNNISEGAGQ